MAMMKKPARKATKRTATKKVAGRTVKGRRSMAGRATLKAQQTRRAAKKGTRVAVRHPAIRMIPGGNAYDAFSDLYDWHRERGASHEKAKRWARDHIHEYGWR